MVRNSCLLLLITALVFLLDGRAYADLKNNLVIAIDVGHSKASSGAMSARGRAEFEFNLEIGNLVRKILEKKGFAQAYTIINPESLIKRTQIANEKRTDLFVSIHHDSVQSFYLNNWNYLGKNNKYCDLFKGFSLLVSTKNPEFKKSLLLATMIGRQLKKQGLVPTLHHAENVQGERHYLFNEKLGIYKYDDLVVLKTTQMPAVLVEVGVIVNRSEEVRLQQKKDKEKAAKAIANGILQYNDLVFNTGK